MRVEWDARAVTDLEEIHVFVGADKPAVAVRVAERIKLAVGRLRQYPRMGRQTSEPSIRILPITGTPYVVYYQALPDVVIILAVFHGARRRFIY